nr:unnamed protein product [Naegleria fowleri]
MNRRKPVQSSHHDDHSDDYSETITQQCNSHHASEREITVPMHSTKNSSQKLLYKTLIENLKLNNQNNNISLHGEHDQEAKTLDQRTMTLLRNHQNFLSELKINQDLEIYNYWDTSKECLALATQFTCCCLFCLIFFLIYEWEPSGKFQSFEIMAIIILFNFVFILPFLYIHRTLRRSSEVNVTDENVSSHQSMDIPSFISTVFNWIIVVLILLGASPILRTLTLLYSQDTIIALVCLLFTIHLFTHDYYFVNGKTEKFNCYLSLNCVIFISALFASRLRHSLDAFVILLVAIELFLLFPFVRHQLRKVRLCIILFQ